MLNCVFVGVFQKTIESETVKTSEVLKKTLGTISETVKEVGITAFLGVPAHLDMQFVSFQRTSIFIYSFRVFLLT